MLPSTRRPWSGCALAAALTLVAAGCGTATTQRDDGAAPVRPAVPAASADDAVDRVLAISVDGLNPRALSRLGAARTPTLHRLLREGASTTNARTAWESTSTLPNHTGMLTGRRVDARAGGHGVDLNRDTGSTVHRAAGRYVPSVFDVVHDRGGSTALFSTKTKFRLYQRSWVTAGAPDRVGKDHGRAKIDRFTVDTDDARLVAALNADLARSARTFTFLHVSLPDEAGHAHGFMGARYLAAVQETDRLLGTVVRTITTRPALRDHLLVVLTADHGGDGAAHSTPTRGQNYRIPFVVWGPGVARGENLHARNLDYVSPGSGRPGYGGRQPVRNADLANLVTDVLDLPRVPGSQLNARRTLDAFG